MDVRRMAYNLRHVVDEDNPTYKMTVLMYFSSVSHVDRDEVNEMDRLTSRLAMGLKAYIRW